MAYNDKIPLLIDHIMALLLFETLRQIEYVYAYNRYVSNNDRPRRNQDPVGDKKTTTYNINDSKFRHFFHDEG